MSQCERILAVLADGREHSHHEFYGWCVFHSRVAELRKRGHRIEQRREGDVYLYRLVEQSAPVGDLAASSSAPHPSRTGELERAPYPLIDGQLNLIPS